MFVHVTRFDAPDDDQSGMLSPRRFSVILQVGHAIGRAVEKASVVKKNLSRDYFQVDFVCRYGYPGSRGDQPDQIFNI